MMDLHTNHGEPLRQFSAQWGWVPGINFDDYGTGVMVLHTTRGEPWQKGSSSQHNDDGPHK